MADQVSKFGKFKRLSQDRSCQDRVWDWPILNNCTKL